MFEKLLKTRHDAKANAEATLRSATTLPKIMSKELKSDAEAKPEAERQTHIFQIGRFTESQNLRITSIIKRFIPTETEAAAMAIHSVEAKS